MPDFESSTTTIPASGEIPPVQRRTLEGVAPTSLTRKANRRPWAASRAPPSARCAEVSTSSSVELPRPTTTMSSVRPHWLPGSATRELMVVATRSTPSCSSMLNWFNRWPCTVALAAYEALCGWLRSILCT